MKLFYGRYQNLREKLDYNFHQNYSRERQIFQDELINKLLKINTEKKTNKPITVANNPRLIYTAGCMGAGKTHSIRKLADQLDIDLDNFVMIDPDKFKEMIPEYQEMKLTDPRRAGTYYHLESAILSELALEIALQNNYNVICDGSMVDHVWFTGEILRIQEKYPNYKENITIIYVKSDWNKIIERVERRCIITKRCVNQTKLRSIYQKIDHSISMLRPLVSKVIYIDNNDVPRIISDHCILATDT